jgi:hypothetical protein
VSYLAGSARLWSVGYPTVELGNVAPMTRLQTVSSGCIVAGGEWIIELPNNAVLVALTLLFGPMRGTYAGPYPNADDIDEVLAGGKAVALADVSADHIRLAARDVRLRAGTGSKLAAALSEREGIARPVATGALWKNRIFVLRVQFPDSADERPLDALVDVDSGKIIAYHGSGLDRRLPKQWAE